MSKIRTENLAQAYAYILQPPLAGGQGLTRQLEIIGLRVVEVWPELPIEAISADFVLYDVDQGHDAQFPWPAGQSPMPMIAIIGSEAPGRLQWAMTMGAHAQLLKPVGNNGIYAALLVARSNFDRDHASQAQITSLETRLSARQTVVQAVMIFVMRGKTEAQAYEALRQIAMAWRVTIEDAAARVVASNANERVQDDSACHG